jgi:hypothetical protein
MLKFEKLIPTSVDSMRPNWQLRRALGNWLGQRRRNETGESRNKLDHGRQ